jgi:hypothetical protein
MVNSETGLDPSTIQADDICSQSIEPKLMSAKGKEKKGIRRRANAHRWDFLSRSSTSQDSYLERPVMGLREMQKVTTVSTIKLAAIPKPKP